MQFHVAIADNVPGSPSGEYTVTAGETATLRSTRPARMTCTPRDPPSPSEWRICALGVCLQRGCKLADGDAESARERSGRRVHTGCEPLRLLLQHLRTRRRQWRYLRSRGAA